MAKGNAKPVIGEAPEPENNKIELPKALRDKYELKNVSTPYLETALFGRIDLRKITAKQAEAMVKRGSAYVVEKVSS